MDSNHSAEPHRDHRFEDKNNNKTKYLIHSMNKEADKGAIDLTHVRLYTNA